MSGRTTIQDAADAPGASRNRVSKAISNRGNPEDSAREMVRKEGDGMGYGQFSHARFGDHDSLAADRGTLSAAELFPERADREPFAAGCPHSSEPKGMIAMLSPRFLGNSHFSTAMLDNFESQLTRYGYNFAMYRISRQNLEQKVLPASISAERVDGIICFEMFDPAYCEMLCGLGIPVLFTDCPSPRQGGVLDADLLMMENRASIFRLVKEMARRGKKKMGFIGESDHCLSFYERYMGFRESMLTLGLHLQEKYCITGNRNVQDPSPEEYREYLLENLRNMKELPDLFLCANDFVALDTMHALKKLGISVPDDVYLCGFGDSPETRVVTPALSSVHIRSGIMGASAVYLLMTRIQNPSLDYRRIYTETTPVYRTSTGD